MSSRAPDSSRAVAGRSGRRPARLAAIGFVALLALACGREPFEEDGNRLRADCNPATDPACINPEVLLDLGLGDAGYGPSLLLLNETGTQGIAVFEARFDDGFSELKALRWDRSQTEVETIDADVGPYTSLGRHPFLDRIYVAYFKREGGLYLAVRDGGAWSTRPLDEGGEIGRFNSMVVDVNGGVHIAYIDGANQDLRYLLWLDGSFLQPPTVVDTGLETGQVIAGGAVGFATSIDLSLSQEPSISYFDKTNGQLRLARYSSVTQEWAITAIGRYRERVVVFPDSAGVANLPGGGRMIARPAQIELYEDLEPVPRGRWRLLSASQVEIDSVRSGAEYAISYSEPWGPNYGSWSSLRIGTAGTWVSFYDMARGDLLVAFNEAPSANPRWTFEVVDSFGAVGDFNAMAIMPLIDANGIQRGEIPVVTYFDQSNGDLKLAYRHRGRWFDATLDSPGITGLNPAIAVSSEGWVVIAYHDFDFTTGQARLKLLRTIPVRP